MNRRAVAVDLDRTLFPNGQQEYDGSMEDFREIIRAGELLLVFVTGRNARQTMDGIREYNAPFPDFLIAEVGTRLYTVRDGEFTEDQSYIEYISNSTRSWNADDLRTRFQAMIPLELQEDENQNRFKVSFYVKNPEDADQVISEVKDVLNGISPDAAVTFSVDETKHLGLLDIMPKNADKLAGLEFLRKKEKLRKEDIVFAGDSGNDLVPLTSGYKAILVRNAIPEVRKQVEETARGNNSLGSVYFARGKGKYNGYYVSGVIEGLAHFGFGGLPETG